MHHDIAQMLNN